MQYIYRLYRHVSTLNNREQQIYCAKEGGNIPPNDVLIFSRFPPDTITCRLLENTVVTCVQPKQIK